MYVCACAWALDGQQMLPVFWQQAREQSGWWNDSTWQASLFGPLSSLCKFVWRLCFSLYFLAGSRCPPPKLQMEGSLSTRPGPVLFFGTGPDLRRSLESKFQTGSSSWQEPHGSFAGEGASYFYASDMPLGTISHGVNPSIETRFVLEQSCCLHEFGNWQVNGKLDPLFLF